MRALIDPPSAAPMHEPQRAMSINVLALCPEAQQDDAAPSPLHTTPLTKAVSVRPARAGWKQTRPAKKRTPTVRFAVLTAVCVACIVIVVLLSSAIPVSVRMTNALVNARQNEMTAITRGVGQQFAEYFSEATVASELVERMWNQSLVADPHTPMKHFIATHSMSLFHYLSSRKRLTACYIAAERNPDEIAPHSPCDLDALLISTTYRAVICNETSGTEATCAASPEDPRWHADEMAPHVSCRHDEARLVGINGMEGVPPLQSKRVIFSQRCDEWLLASTKMLNADNFTMRGYGEDPGAPVHGLTRPTWGWSWPRVAGGKSKMQSVIHGSLRPLTPQPWPAGRPRKMLPLAFCSITVSEKKLGGGDFLTLGGILRATVVNMQGNAASGSPTLFVLSHKQEFVASSLPDVVPEHEGLSNDGHPTLLGLKKYDDPTLPCEVRDVGAWIMHQSCPAHTLREDRPSEPCDFSALPSPVTLSGQVVVFHRLEDPKAANLGLVLAMMVPHAEIKKPAKDACIEVLVISVVVTVVAVVASAAFGVCISMPIGNVCELMLGAASLEDLETIAAATKKFSVVSEIASMQSSLHTLITALVMYKQFLPQSVLTRDDADEPPASISLTRSSSLRVDKSTCDDRDQENSAASSHSTPRTRSLNSGALKLVGDRTAVSLTHKRVSFVMVNIREWHARIKGMGDAKILATHGGYIASAVKIFQDLRGMMDSFSGDRLLCSFNATKTVTGHRVVVCKALVSCRDVMQSQHGLSISAAAASGNARVGNMGCDVMRKHTLVSPAVSLVHALERFACAFDVDCLVDTWTAEEAKGHFTVQKVDEVVYRKRSPQPISVFNIVRQCAPGSGGEWMYQLEESMCSPTASWNEWVDTVVTGNTEGAARLAEEAAQYAPSAKVLARMTAAMKRFSFAPTKIMFH